MATWLALELEAARDGNANGTLAPETLVNTGDRFAERLQLAYADRANHYLRQVDAAYALFAKGGYRPADHFPEVLLTLPLGAELVVFNADLDIQLLQLYALHGWEGVLALERAVNERRSYPPLGVPEPWAEVQSFLRATRYLLTLRIRSALVGIERIVRTSITDRLGRSAKTLDDTIALLKIRQTAIDRGESGARGGPGSAGTAMRAQVGNREVLAKIQLQFDTILRGKNALARMRLDLRILEASIGATRQVLRQKTEGLSGGVELPSERAERAESKALEAAESERRALVRDSIDAGQALRQLEASLGDLAMPLLLAIPQLKAGFAMEDTERAIAETLFSIRQHIDELVAAFDGSGSVVAASLPIDPADLDTTDRLDQAALRPIDACVAIVASALGSAADNPAWLAMLSEEALLSALAEDQIKRGSLEHIVVVHYLVALLDGLERQRKDEENTHAIVQGLSKLAATLSLASLLASRHPTPQAQAAAGTMRLLGRVLELPLALYFAYSTLHRMSQLDAALKLRLAAAEFDSLESVAQLAEINAIRNGFAEQIGTEIAKLLVENIAAGQLTALKKLILMRGYFDDLVTLLPSDEGDHD